jgi:hypothetical protein
MSEFANEHDEARSKQAHAPKAAAKDEASEAPGGHTEKPSDTVLTKLKPYYQPQGMGDAVKAGINQAIKKRGASKKVAGKNAAPVQTASWPGGAAGDKVERINFIDTSSIIAMVKSQCRNMDLENNGLADHLLNVFSGDFFYGAAAWTSGPIDDGWNDTWNAGLADVDMRVSIELSVVNPRERNGEHVESTATASGSSASANTSSATTTVGGTAEVSASVGGGGQPGAGAKVAGTASQADTTATTTGNAGSRSDTAAYKNKRMIGDVQMSVTVSYNATVPGMDFSTDRGTFKIGDVIYLQKDI